MQDRIDAVFTSADQHQVLQLIQQIKDLMPFLIDLSPDEIKSLSKMGDRGQPFVEDAVTLAEQDDSFLPRSFEVAKMRKDVDLLEMLPPVMTAVANLYELLKDTHILAGSDAFTAGLIVYDSAQKNGNGAGLSESLLNMGKRFTQRGKPQKPKTEPPKT